MHLARLKLVNFRNYRSLDLELGEGLSIFCGANASGKTSLLEAIYFLATARSPRTSNQSELVNLYAEGDLNFPPFARIEADLHRAAGNLQIEITLLKVDPLSEPAVSTKRIKINGVARRTSDLVGRVNVVLFSPEDVELVAGAPVLRRRFLDIALSQIDHRYLTTLQRLHRVILQRNSLLRSFQQKGISRLSGTLKDELAFWDDEFVAHGSYILVQRFRAVEAIRREATRFYHILSGGEELQLRYRSTVHRPMLLPKDVDASVAMVKQVFCDGLEAFRARELARGVSMVGPHRDDIELEVNGLPLAAFGSRGQQRTAALSLRLAEMKLIEAAVGEAPLILLDDVMSELDPDRRRLLADHLLSEGRQVLVTTVDADQVVPAIRSRARLHRVESGTIALQPSRV